MHDDNLSGHETAAYEVALDILAQLVGHADDELENERGQAAPNQERIGEWLERREAWALRRRSLQPRDRAEIHDVIEREGAQLRVLTTDD